jgi:hypothetical protein
MVLLKFGKFILFALISLYTFIKAISVPSFYFLQNYLFLLIYQRFSFMIVNINTKFAANLFAPYQA